MGNDSHSEIRLGIFMHERLSQQFGDGPPFQFTVLVVRGQPRATGQLSGEPESDVVGADIRCAKKIVGVKMIEHANKCRFADSDAQFAMRYAPDGLFDSLVLENAPTRDKPRILCWSVHTLAEQYFAGFVANNQVNRHQGRGIHDAKEFLVLQHGTLVAAKQAVAQEELTVKMLAGNCGFGGFRIDGNQLK